MATTPCGHRSNGVSHSPSTVADWPAITTTATDGLLGFVPAASVPSLSGI